MVDLGLKETYPFLKTIWNKYKYDEDVEESMNDDMIISLCNENTTYGITPSDDQKKACKKLLKNFRLLHINERKSNEYFEWCNNFNNWIYYEINPYKLTDNIVHNILIEAQKKLISLSYKHYCTYNSVKEEDHLEKIIKLRIFNDNIETFRSILKSESGPVYCSCQNFLQNCVNIYRNMKQPYCSKQETQIYSEEMCKEINQFQFFYEFLTKESTIVKKIPNIGTGIREEKLLNCPSTDESLKLQSPVDSRSDAPIQKKDSAVPTALGTVAGASSVLALLYKFTPAGRFINFGLRKSGGRINNGLQEGYSSELGFDGMEHNLINSYNIGYEAA